MAALRKLGIYRVYHNDTRHPDFEGCIHRADPLQIIPWSANGYVAAIQEALATGVTLDPGVYLLYEAAPLGGLIFTIADDGRVIQGMTDPGSASMPRLTSWPPRKR